MLSTRLRVGIGRALIYSFLFIYFFLFVHLPLRVGCSGRGLRGVELGGYFEGVGHEGQGWAAAGEQEEGH